MRKAWKPGAADELLTRPWPIADLDDKKKIWHFSQFFALRQLALEKGTLAMALRAQENMAALDQRWAAENPLPRRINGNAVHPGLQEMLPPWQEAAVNAEPRLLDAVLKRSRMAKAKDEDGDEDDSGR
jgi:hypothetical protein